MGFVLARETGLRGFLGLHGVGWGWVGLGWVREKGSDLLVVRELSRAKESLVPRQSAESCGFSLGGFSAFCTGELLLGFGDVTHCEAHTGELHWVQGVPRLEGCELSLS